MLKTKPMLAEAETAHVRDMVYVIIHKLKYDEEYDFQALGEDEAMFQEYRYVGAERGDSDCRRRRSVPEMGPKSSPKV